MWRGRGELFECVPVLCYISISLFTKDGHRHEILEFKCFLVVWGTLNYAIGSFSQFTLFVHRFLSIASYVGIIIAACICSIVMYRINDKDKQTTRRQETHVSPTVFCLSCYNGIVPGGDYLSRNNGKISGPRVHTKQASIHRLATLTSSKDSSIFVFIPDITIIFSRKNVK